MARPERIPPEAPRRVRANDWGPMGGPILPGEVRPLAPVPAASTSGNGPTLPEKELIAQLVKHYRWVHMGAGHLKRYNPHGRDMDELCGAPING